ncbi:glycosyltransferase [Chitinophaga pendula]|uniref:galactosyltransferase-related protein n=1 Tax=Chitinophaga TaxID=79328 RepID=UPI000BAF4E35|nr:MULTISPECIES: galactosyltransferase-related protein [Chitinophaga]ASZ13767.1 glycosyl transferase family 2 [Chitinophaga sp. MD30]UCJ08613.1 glycosyltransferase [Chitinophaga pendula]
MQSVLFSIIIPWSNRPSLLQTLQDNRAAFLSYPTEIIIVNGGGDEAMLTDIVRQADLDIQVLSLSAMKVFNKCYCLNVGAHHAKGQYLFFLDADIIFTEALLTEVLTYLPADHFVTVEKVKESAAKPGGPSSYLSELAYYIEIADITQRRVKIETSRIFINEKSRSAPGLIFMKRADFETVNGMNAALEGWGWEDNDLLARLQLVLALQWKRCGSAIHLTHGDDVRVLPAGSRQVSEQRNFGICLDNYSQGNYLGTYKQDIESYLGTPVAP